ncbi:hypothetical protein Msil_3193 [Methylocella silvestris BL2]|uniref:Uncharacterized protein n=1 Tax=Methylocella silvestris (strain DSM 15510 / CIP 108128 / LMG 27833 / NCIMB 13906 / BL2) TaxID=395965 RepID=B8EMH2_METSB|nr:hypothetical protein Msil_3193 [Methylocella silvestris BL2]
MASPQKPRFRPVEFNVGDVYARYCILDFFVYTRVKRKLPGRMAGASKSQSPRRPRAVNVAANML